MTRHAIPVDPADFDAAVVEDLIQTKFPQVRVDSVRAVDSALCSDDEQRVSTAGRVTVDVDYAAHSSDGLPNRLTIKVARPGLGDIPLYDNEVDVYKNLADEFPVLTPRCFGAIRDKAQSSFAIAMEDLRPLGAQFPNVLTPTSAEDVRGLLDQLAALHAAYWESPRFDGELAWVQPHTSGPLHDLFTHDAGVPMLIKWEVQSQQFKRELLESAAETAESLREKVTAARWAQAKLPATLVHGDCHIGNTFVLPDGRRGLLDWQLTARGYCMHDVSYLIITGLSVRDRRRHEEELIAHYRQRLVDSGVHDAPTTETLRYQHRLAAAWCFYIGWLSTPVENYGWEINVANQIRLATAYRDLESNAALQELLDDSA